MIELPEALVLAQQINGNIIRKRILNVTAAQSPHKFAFFNGDPQKYHELLQGKVVNHASGFGGMVEIAIEDMALLFGDGVGIRYHQQNEKRPDKHQLLIEFEDFSALSASVQMYGGLWCYKAGEYDNRYYLQAKTKTPPLSEKFDMSYFESIISAPGNEKLSAKALLATEQRIPGLGNGVLQDILYNAGVHPKKKVSAFTKEDREKLFNSVKSTLAEMTFKGGRDVEKDLFGCPGGYKTKLGKLTIDKPCPVCGSAISKEAYLGGSIYYCKGCQII